MKKGTIILVMFAVIISSLLLSYFLTKDWKEYISNVSTLVSLIATVITLGIALLLINQLGIDQTILQRKADVVFRLLDLLNERYFRIETNLGFQLSISLTTISKNKNEYSKYADIKLLFNSEYLDYNQPIIDLTDDVFLPKEILLRIQRLEPTVFGSQQSKINNPEYGKVVGLTHKIRHPYKVSSKDNDDWGTLLFQTRETEQITVGEFIDLWNDLIITSTNWIANRSVYEDLNIPFFRDYYPKARKLKLKRLSDWLMEEAF